MKTFADPRDKTDVLERLSRLRPDSRRQWGHMSAHQAVCHMADSFRAVTGQRDVSPATGPLQQTVVKWIALHVPVPWPKGIGTRPEVDQLMHGTCPGDFAVDVADLRALVEQITAPAGVTWTAHPIFGPLSKAEWLRWAYLHMDHHLRQFGL